MTQFSSIADPPPPRSNTPGIVGFVFSVLGLLGCGLLSPVGVVVSCVGLRRPPKGLAVAGLIIGVLGTLWLIVLALMVAGFVAVGYFSKAFVVTIMTSAEIDEAISTYENTHNGAPPATLAELTPGLLKAEKLNDGWGRPWRYAINPDGKSYQLISDGPDKTPGTDDDVNMGDDPPPSSAPAGP